MSFDSDNESDDDDSDTEAATTTKPTNRPLNNKKKKTGYSVSGILLTAQCSKHSNLCAHKNNKHTTTTTNNNNKLSDPTTTATATAATGTNINNTNNNTSVENVNNVVDNNSNGTKRKAGPGRGNNKRHAGPGRGHKRKADNAIPLADTYKLQGGLNYNRPGAGGGGGVLGSGINATGNANGAAAELQDNGSGGDGGKEHNTTTTAATATNVNGGFVVVPFPINTTTTTSNTNGTIDNATTTAAAGNTTTTNNNTTTTDELGLVLQRMKEEQKQWGCARAAPIFHGARRGQRAPEALAAAADKRRYVAAVPLVLGSGGRKYSAMGSDDFDAIGFLPRNTTSSTDGGGSIGGEESGEVVVVKRKRGRPPKNPKPDPPSVQQQAVAVVGNGATNNASQQEKGEGGITTNGTTTGTECIAPRMYGSRCIWHPAPPEVLAMMNKDKEDKEMMMMVDNTAIESKSKSTIEEESNHVSAVNQDNGDATTTANATTEAAPLQPQPQQLEHINTATTTATIIDNLSEPASPPPPTDLSSLSPLSPLHRPGLKSMAEKYQELQRTIHARVVPGKSAIHGWGAFARRAISKGDMVIEYIGELVRPAVADARERACYDSLVGAGTYIFRLNRAECVDATHTGNLAHLLNHSCAPNCHSRTVSVVDESSQQVIDHVIIFALRDINEWEELTYDYRFCGEEQLNCNCGAETCRGMVNEKPPQDSSLGGLRVPRSKVKKFVPPREKKEKDDGKDDGGGGGEKEEGKVAVVVEEGVPPPAAAGALSVEDVANALLAVNSLEEQGAGVGGGDEEEDVVERKRKKMRLSVGSGDDVVELELNIG